VRIITAADRMEVKPGIFRIFDQHVRTHQGAGDAPDEDVV